VDTDSQVAPEREIAIDLVRRGAIIAPAIILLCGLLRGWDGAASAAIALGIVLLNFSAAAAITTRASKSGTAALGAAALGGYIVRLVVILVALALLRQVSWIDIKVLGFVLVGTHLGLLFWETKYVSLTLAAPGLRPARPTGDK
jgi:hypothetical protein